MRKFHKTQLNPEDLVLNFKSVVVNVDCNPLEVDESQKTQITQLISQLAEDILIDYTYVDYEGTKYCKTFIVPEGWNKLCEALCCTDFGQNCSAGDKDELRDAYSAIIIQYLYQALEDFGYSLENICLEIPENSSFTVEFRQQHIVDNYPGQWQTW